MSYSLIPINQAVTFDAVTMDPGTGSVTDADSAPVYDVFEDTTDTPILSAQTMTKRTSKTGNYRGTFTASAANGFEAGKCYNVIASATVTNTVTSTAITSKKACLTFRCAPAEVQSGVPLADASYFAGQTITAAAGVTLPSSVASPTNITAGTITTATSVTNAVTLTSSERNSVADALLDRANAIETGWTLRMVCRVMAAALGGKLSGAATTTVTVRDVTDAKARITATVDASGNRSAVTLDGT
jgi:hypothetical protein